MFIELKATFDPVGYAVLCLCLPLQGVPEEIISPLQATFANRRSHSIAFDIISLEFTMTNGVFQGCPVSLYPRVGIVKLVVSLVINCLI